MGGKEAPGIFMLVQGFVGMAVPAKAIAITGSDSIRKFFQTHLGPTKGFF